MKKLLYAVFLLGLFSSCAPRLDQPGLLDPSGEVALTGRRLGAREEGVVFVAGRELGWQQVRSWNSKKVEVHLGKQVQDALLQIRRRGRYSNAILLDFKREDPVSRPLYHPSIDEVDPNPRSGMVVTLKGNDLGFFSSEHTLFWQNVNQDLAVTPVRLESILQWTQERIRVVAPRWGAASVWVDDGRLASNRVDVVLPPRSGQELWK